MRRELILRSRQQVRRVHTTNLRRLILHLLEDLLGLDAFELGVTLVAAPEMTRLNERFLQHAGSTDVISFDYSDAAFHEPATLPAEARRAPARPPTAPRVHGEIYVCLDDAVTQARQFQTTWPSELVRYVVHGVLHLRGYDDLQPAARRIMKREENRLVRHLEQQFDLGHLSRARNLASSRTRST